MSDVIEPAAIIGPDGAFRTGWELPQRIVFAFDFAADFNIDRMMLRYRYGGPASSPLTIRIMGTGI